MYIRSIGFTAFTIGILFMPLHWPGAKMIMLAGALLTLLAVGLLLAHRQEPLTIQVQRPGVLFVSVALTLFGVLFKMTQWPGGNIMLLVGMVALGVFFNLSSVIAQRPEQRS